ncbi:hypothetical protein GWI33_000193 [Rhynchophorus ferrugineus]|uniref:Putative inorganic phosphate cotransporter n=1 Tax=Rhynchophorus ferrugineus TaxID=354439 RepID=A0A834IWT9_RHYFE|nr:hypothetical protein GWI33_000193 [Rhynchophorus ferrugineus]
MTNSNEDKNDNYSYTEVNQKLVYQFENGDENWVKTVPKIGIRHLQVFIYFMLGFLAFGFRVTLSVGIVAMTDPKTSINPDIPTYPEWTNKNVILSSFFWGYIVPQLFAAWMAKKYGPKWFLIGSAIMQSILFILMPITAAYFGSTGVIVSRILQGLSQGFIFPSFAYLLCQWVPIEERARLGSAVFAAGKLGTVFSMLITGVISASWYGWPMVFYVFGGLGFLWCFLMGFLGYDSPDDHPSISMEEKKYIESSLGKTETTAKHEKTPWKGILSSFPVWALLLAQTGNNYCFWTLVTQIPTYMNYVMHFNIKKNSLLSSIPYLTLWILSFVFGIISDALVNKGILKRSFSRKFFNSIGLLVPAVALICLGYTEAGNNAQAVILLIIAVGFNGACFSGFAINHMDLSPNHAGSVMGICNAASQVAGALAPLIVQLIVSDETNIIQWRYVFLLSAGVNTFCALAFIIFGSGKPQPWDKEESNENTTEA